MLVTLITSKLNFETSGGSVMDIDLKARTLQSLGNRVKVITVFSKENKIKSPPPYGVIEEYISSKKLMTIQRGIFRILKKYSLKTDVFHLDGHLFLYGAGFYKLLGGQVPIIAHFNRELICWPENRSNFLKIEKKKSGLFFKLKNKIRWFLEKYLGTILANQIDLFSFANPVLKKTYEDFGLRQINSFTIGDLVDHQKIRSEADILEDSYIKRNKTTGIINIFYTGRMAAGKGFDTLVMAFSKIKNKENLHLILGGAGSEETALHQLVSNLKMGPYVEFLGWMPKQKIYDYFRQADVFVLPKCMRLEFNSITLLEAMVFSLPCIVPLGGALAWGAGKGALTYTDEDSDDLAKKIVQLAASPQLREELSRNCIARLKDDELTYTKQVQRLNEYLLKLVI